jgi:hypothetical protein
MMKRYAATATELLGIPLDEIQRVPIPSTAAPQAGFDLRGGLAAGALLAPFASEARSSLEDYADLARVKLLGDVAGYVADRPTVLVVRADAISVVALGHAEVIGGQVLFDLEQGRVLLRLATPAGARVLDADTDAYVLHALPDAALAPPLGVWLGGAPLDPWLEQALTDRLDVGTPAAALSAVGLVLRLKPVPVPLAANELRRLITSGAPPPLVAAARGWLASLNAGILADVEAASVRETDAAREALVALAHDDPNGARAIALARDDGACVWTALRLIGAGESLRTALAALDAAADDHAPTLGDALADAVASPVLDAVARAEPDAWWASR